MLTSALREPSSSVHYRSQGASRTGPQEFPGLRQIVREVETAWALRETTQVVAALNARMPALIEQYRPQLPGWAADKDMRGYRRIELHHCPVQGFQILAMVWGPGQGTPVHDHREQWGIESVWQGELDVIDFAVRETAGDFLRLEPNNVSRLLTGQSLGFTPEQGLHLCRNPSSRDVTLSLHIYARALDVFNKYVDVGSGWYERREHTPELEF
jgi:3-mercaptopropionate dioxygenase